MKQSLIKLVEYNFHACEGDDIFFIAGIDQVHGSCRNRSLNHRWFYGFARRVASFAAVHPFSRRLVGTGNDVQLRYICFTIFVVYYRFTSETTSQVVTASLYRNSVTNARAGES